MEWIYHCLHIPTFRAAQERFWQLAPEERVARVEPAWLAVYLLALCLSIHFRTAQVQNEAQAEEEEETFFEVCMPFHRKISVPP